MAHMHMNENSTVHLLLLASPPLVPIYTYIGEGWCYLKPLSWQVRQLLVLCLSAQLSASYSLVKHVAMLVFSPNQPDP